MSDALTPEMKSRVMVDGRDAERPLIELRAEMWTWMSKKLRRVAIIANEERTTQRVARSAEMVLADDEAHERVLAGVVADRYHRGDVGELRGAVGGGAHGRRCQGGGKVSYHARP